MISDPLQLPPEGRADTTGSRWTVIKQLFEAALALQGAERNAFVERECAGNEEIRREVLSLLAAYEETGDFLENPLGSARSLLDTRAPGFSAEPAALGTRIGAYRLEQEIGQGGMGAVYLATRADSEFDKRVAIKLIRDGAANEFAIRRFRNERQILARLENAYIARLIDGGTTENGLPYFVMEYVEGQPVTQYCDANSLAARDRLQLFLKICSAVQYAHERNIIHRDLKPGNILVKRDGSPKLLDFGIAKIMGAEISKTNNEATIAGFRMLTPAYASPEQMRGDPATPASDVYSLGVILYELLCGERPNLGTFERRVSDSDTQDAHLSLHLRAIVFNAIRLDPRERYASVEAFASDIHRYLSGVPPQSAAQASFLPQERTAKVSIAILPFRVLGDQSNSHGFLASGVTDALITRLSRLERLSIPPPSAVLKYSSGIEAVRAAKDLRVQYVLEGSIHVAGEYMRASVQLVFAEAGISVWAAQFDEQAKDLLKFEDSIAEQVANALIPHLTGEEREQLTRSGTANSRAHECYLRGRWHWSRSSTNQEELAQALVCFMEAIAADPNYARAHAGVADYYLRLGLWGGLPPAESFAAALQSAETAVRLDPTLGEAHASLAFALWAYRGDYATAEQHFNLAIIRNPDYASAHHWFGLLNSARNRPELAIANLERAHKVDPNSPVIAAALGFVYYNARDFQTALRLLLDAARELRKSPVIQEMLVWCYLQTGQNAQALAAARRASELSDRSAASLCALAQAEVACGNRQGAVALRDEIGQMAKQRYISGYDRAAAFLATGQTDDALGCLEEAAADRDWWITWLAVDPRWDSLRKELRFKKLIQKTHAEANAPSRRISYMGWAAIAALLALVCAGAWWTADHRRPTPFSDPKFTKLTSNGMADSATISPDGKTLVYTAMFGAAPGMLRRDLVSGRSSELTPPLSGYVSGLSFTSGGAEVAYVNFTPKQPGNRQLYVVPVAGGAPRRVLGTFPGPVSLSFDGRRTASVEGDDTAGQDDLWITETSTGQRRVLTSYKYPERFVRTAKPAWSDDGNFIAYAVEQRDTKGFLIRIFVINVKTSARRAVETPRWQVVQSIAWTHDRSALALTAQDQEASFQQIWYVPYPRGEVRRIGNDFENYYGAAVTADNSKLVSVEAQTVSNIYVTKPSDWTHAEQITPGSGRYFDLSWTTDGHILYASDARGSADIWIMNQDGTGERQLTSSSGRNYAPVSSFDGKAIAFHSNRSGNWHVWRMNADGSDPRQLSVSLRDGNWPQFTRDGKFIVFHQSDARGAFNVWKTPADGGPPVRLTNAAVMHPAVSPMDDKIAAWYSPTANNPRWQLAIFSPEGGEPLRTYTPTPDAKPDTRLRWTPRGDAIGFMDYANGASNIWLQPIDGRPPHAITSFSSGDIYAFDWSQDGRLVYSRGLISADVLLIQDRKARQ